MRVESDETDCNNANNDDSEEWESTQTQIKVVDVGEN